jgi:NAD(P)-dependent dehydrogenase (short-subunit alcohol dehydrogenase family)
MRELDKQSMIEVLTVNAIGPALVAKHFLPRMRKEGKTVFAALSARVGSIGDNRLGGWLSYRASKAALNMLLATLAIEHARSRPESVVIGLHPGTVKSNLSHPFTENLRDGILFSPKDAAACLLEVIDSLTSADTGNFLAWDGSRIVY